MVDVDVVGGGKGRDGESSHSRKEGAWVELRKTHNFEGPCGWGFGPISRLEVGPYRWHTSV